MLNQRGIYFSEIDKDNVDIYRQDYPINVIEYEQLKYSAYLRYDFDANNAFELHILKPIDDNDLTNIIRLSTIRHEIQHYIDYINFKDKFELRIKSSDILARKYPIHWMITEFRAFYVSYALKFRLYIKLFQKKDADLKLVSKQIEHECDNCSKKFFEERNIYNYIELVSLKLVLDELDDKEKLIDFNFLFPEDVHEFDKIFNEFDTIILDLYWTGVSEDDFRSLNEAVGSFLFDELKLEKILFYK